MVMLLTFLNLVVVSGVLVGLIEGAVRANRDFYTSDVLISPLDEKDYIENTTQILSVLKTIPGVTNTTARYISSGAVEANYKERSRLNEKKESVGTLIAGINPEQEDEVTGLSSFIVEGNYLTKNSFDEVVIGSQLLTRFFPIESPGFATLDDVFVGSKVRISVGDKTREMTVVGILSSKVDEVARRAFINESQLRAMSGRNDFNVDEIAVLLTTNAESQAKFVKEALVRNGFSDDAKIQTFVDAQPKFLQDIKDTFALLGSIISSIGLVVAAITIFIVIFINAITREKYIGIMKAIGVTKTAIEASYVLQSFFYAIIGSALGLLLVYFVLVPFIAANPINFPFSDGILVAPAESTIFRLVLLVITTAIAGYIPARLITKKDTLEAILGKR
jgi:ABC-type lipoprotein release transport system permease subunit